MVLDINFNRIIEMIEKRKNNAYRKKGIETSDFAINSNDVTTVLVLVKKEN